MGNVSGAPVTSSSKEIANAVAKDLMSDFKSVVVVSPDPVTLRRAEARTAEKIPAKDRSKVRFLSPDSLRDFLGELPGREAAGDRVAGYRVRVEGALASGSARRRAAARLAGTALLARRSS